MEFFATGRGERGKTKLFVSCCWQVVTTATTAPSARPASHVELHSARWCLGSTYPNPATSSGNPNSSLPPPFRLAPNSAFAKPEPHDADKLFVLQATVHRWRGWAGAGDAGGVSRGSHSCSLVYFKKIYNIDYKLLTNFKRKPCV